MVVSVHYSYQQSQSTISKLRIKKHTLSLVHDLVAEALFLSTTAMRTMFTRHVSILSGPSTLLSAHSVFTTARGTTRARCRGALVNAESSLDLGTCLVKVLAVLLALRFLEGGGGGLVGAEVGVNYACDALFRNTVFVCFFGVGVAVGVAVIDVTALIITTLDVAVSRLTVLKTTAIRLARGRVAFERVSVGAWCLGRLRDTLPEVVALVVCGVVVGVCVVLGVFGVVVVHVVGVVAVGEVGVGVSASVDSIDVGAFRIHFDVWSCDSCDSC